ncbi:hydrolase [Alkalimonas amylolytica]|uniref:Nicotinamidase-related amidase n=1 Tax=Alkalimonas amylolytica TaxID=152573 RepID=A0A1H4CH24_ALKAM|nr:hydrolase [Alkalimonas amylolytica]SEA59658.1 Nicotinamidase-related amidase [Alkalimonas amylolytica]
MLIDRDQSLVLLIDIQQRLAPAISENREVENAAAWVLQVALQLDVPVLATEQYPAGLGHTVPVLAELLPEDAVLEKMHFSAYKETAVRQRLQELERKQLILLGTETHVCVLQSALDLLDAGYQVYLVEDAVGSRDPLHKQQALQRMQQAGAVVINREMLAFEWLECAGTETFKRIHQGWIR